LRNRRCRNCVTQSIAEAVGAVNLIRDFGVGHHASSFQWFVSVVGQLGRSFRDLDAQLSTASVFRPNTRSAPAMP
jgi:hypothetical protein